jgi:hypothetical protein
MTARRHALSTILATVVVIVAAAVAFAETVPGALASRLVGCWATPSGLRLRFSRRDDQALMVALEAPSTSTSSTTPPGEVTYAPDFRLNTNDRICFHIQGCTIDGARAYCVEWPDGASAPTLLKLQYDHSRILRDRSNGSHPLKVFSTEALSSCRSTE